MIGRKMIGGSDRTRLLSCDPTGRTDTRTVKYNSHNYRVTGYKNRTNTKTDKQTFKMIFAILMKFVAYKCFKMKN